MKSSTWFVRILSFYLIILLFVTLLAPFLTPYDPLSVGLSNILQPPSKEHLFGTDQLGRDVFTRLLYGGRVSLAVGAGAMIIALLFGASYGVISGFFGGVIDRIMMRLLDALLSIPSILLMIGIQVFIPASFLSVVIVIGMTSWMSIARLVRTEVLSLKGEVFIQSSVVVGASSTQLLIRHVLPQCLPTIIVMSIIGMSHAILSEATLSFFGIGIPSHEPSWGNMLMGSQSYLLSGAWWIALFPGLLITCTVLAITFLGDVLQERFSLPQLKRSVK